MATINPLTPTGVPLAIQSIIDRWFVGKDPKPVEITMLMMWWPDICLDPAECQ